MPYLMTHQGMLLELEDGLNRLIEYNVIFVGEDHGSRADHEAELVILKALAERDPSLVLALEMFERDVQDTLNAYLKGTIPENQFLEIARPWPNYDEDYRPLIEFAKEKGLPVIAANVPRRAAAAVAMVDRISQDVVGRDDIYLPKAVHWDSKEYYERFTASLECMPRGGPMHRRNPEALYKSQVLKDAVMAASLEPFLDRRILSCCGHFHSDFHLGIPFQLQKNHPGLQVGVVACVSFVGDLPMKDRSRVADFIWINE